MKEQALEPALRAYEGGELNEAAAWDQFVKDAADAGRVLTGIRHSVGLDGARGTVRAAPSRRRSGKEIP